MDDARRLAILKAQIEEAKGGRPDHRHRWQERTDAALRTTMGDTHPTVARFREIGYTAGIYFEGMDPSIEVEAEIDGVRLGIAILESAMAEIDMRSPAAPATNPTELHPWIAGAVRGVWDDGHYRLAVEEAARSLDVRLKSKLESNLTGTPLFTDAFSLTPPKLAERRLRFPRFKEGSASWTSAHEGAMFFGRGCMMRIRNLIEHEAEPIERQVAVECLSALSLLARWIEEADVVGASDAHESGTA